MCLTNQKSCRMLQLITVKLLIKYEVILFGVTKILHNYQKFKYRQTETRCLTVTKSVHTLYQLIIVEMMTHYLVVLQRS